MQERRSPVPTLDYAPRQRPRGLLYRVSSWTVILTIINAVPTVALVYLSSICYTVVLDLLVYLRVVSIAMVVVTCVLTCIAKGQRGRALVLMLCNVMLLLLQQAAFPRY
jgi:hypothetical protein